MDDTRYKVQEIERVVHKIDNKLDKLDERMDNLEMLNAKMGVTLEANTASLQEHMRRTELLEKAHAGDKAVRKFVMWIVGVVGVSGIGAAIKWFIAQ